MPQLLFISLCKLVQLLLKGGIDSRGALVKQGMYFLPQCARQGGGWRSRAPADRLALFIDWYCSSQHSCENKWLDSAMLATVLDIPTTVGFPVYM